MLVFIILIAIFSTAFVVYPRVEAAKQATFAAQILSGALAQAKGMFPNGTYGGLTNAVASGGEMFPEEMDLDYPNGVLMNNFGDGVNSNITVRGTDQLGNLATGNAARYFTITYEDVPDKVCLKFVPGLATHWGRITVNGVEAINKYDSLKSNDYLDEATVATQCNLGTTVTVTMTSN